MKINIIYASWFGNGKKVAEELFTILAEKKQDVKLFPVFEKSADIITEADLYIFSSPTRKFNIPEEVSVFLNNFMPPKKQAAYALMTTYMDPRTIALKKMRDILDSKDMVKAVSDLKIRSLGLKGPLEKGYGEKLKTFAEEILKLQEV